MRGFNRTAIGFWVVCIGLLLLGSVSAVAEGSATAAVKQVTERMLSALEGRRSELERNPSKIYGLVDQILVPHFDFEKITRAAVGRHWRKASSAQREALIRGFREMLIRTYAKALLNYSGEEIRYLSERPGPRSSAVVSAEVREPGAAPIPIDYKLYRKGKKWKIYDVRIDAVSLVANYRGSFDSQIRRKGIDGLIKSLGEMNAKGKG